MQIRFSFGLTAAFKTNVSVRQGIDGVKTSYFNATEDYATFMKSTSNHLRHLTETNFKELKTDLFRTLDETLPQKIDSEIDNELTALHQLQEIVKSLPEIDLLLNDVKIVTREMQQKSSELKSGKVLRLLLFVSFLNHNSIYRSRQHQARAFEYIEAMQRE